MTVDELRGKIDLHMHTTISDGTDTPEEILAKVKEAGIGLFSVTDHDAIKACEIILQILKEEEESGAVGAKFSPDNPGFITGIEFSCKDDEGKYHILGYNYDPTSEAIVSVVKKGHGFRMKKIYQRLDFLKTEYGFTFPDEEIEKLISLDNPGKPHLGILMTKYGYAESKDEAIREYINKVKFTSEYVSPEEAINGILEAGGIPILAHPSYGSGDQVVMGDDMDARLKRLTKFGLQGVEAFYSGFTSRIQEEVLGFAEKYDLYITAGSDYHGANKIIVLADNNLDTVDKFPVGLERFLKAI